MYTEVSSGHIRVAFHIYHSIVFTVIAIVGAQISKNLTRLDLLGGRPVHVNRMVGWLKGMPLFVTGFQLMAPPGGWALALLMLVCTALASGSILVVAELVKTTSIIGTCAFTEGLVVSTTAQALFNPPPVNSRAYIAASNSQITSLNNGGLVGIYEKCNDDTRFSAQTSDVITRWQCMNNSSDISYPDTYTPDEVVNGLTSGGLLFNTGVYYAATTSNEGFTHFVAWSSSVSEYAATPFDVTVSIDTTPNITDVKIIESFYCSVQGNAVDGILSQIDSWETLDQWVSWLQGLVYYGAGTTALSNSVDIIEQLLNSMVMVAGGNDNLLQTPVDGDDTQGCILLETFISPIVLGIAAFALCLLMGMTGYWMTLRRSVRLAQGYSTLPPLVVKRIPSDIGTWILQAAREATGRFALADLPVGTKELRSWRFSPMGNWAGLHKVMLGRVNNPAVVEDRVQELQEFIPKPGPARYI